MHTHIRTHTLTCLAVRVTEGETKQTDTDTTDTDTETYDSHARTNSRRDTGAHAILRQMVTPVELQRGANELAGGM